MSIRTFTSLNMNFGCDSVLASTVLVSAVAEGSLNKHTRAKVGSVAGERGDKVDRTLSSES